MSKINRICSYITDHQNLHLCHRSEEVADLSHVSKICRSLTDQQKLQVSHRSVKAAGVSQLSSSCQCVIADEVVWSKAVAMVKYLLPAKQVPLHRC